MNAEVYVQGYWHISLQNGCKHKPYPPISALGHKTIPPTKLIKESNVSQTWSLWGSHTGIQKDHDLALSNQQNNFVSWEITCTPNTRGQWTAQEGIGSCHAACLSRAFQAAYIISTQQRSCDTRSELSHFPPSLLHLPLNNLLFSGNFKTQLLQQSIGFLHPFPVSLSFGGMGHT